MKQSLTYPRAFCVIFDEEVTIEGEIIKSSRWPCTRSFVDPVQSFEDQSLFLDSAEESSTNHPNKKYKSYIHLKDLEDAASVDMDEVDQLHKSLDVPCLTADSSVNPEVVALSGPEAEIIAQPSRREVFAEEQRVQLECPPADEETTEHAVANQVEAADVPSSNTSPPLSVEPAKSYKLIQGEEFEIFFRACEELFYRENRETAPKNED
ncbi:uncharacterized protein LOC122652234 isoform X2 [Telopea speciosissima]|uniref:uncharacterized protein LOC122652234 isoform X2 n=1 Tax=Telopea speciosissima TaxID=54955 RepID=UPI001CC6FD97|nr:uncharacterized protein LOC122652234 isoform X2 [Telopea speciosissima]